MRGEQPPGHSPGARAEADEYRRTSHDTWEVMAAGWERWRGQLVHALTPVRDWLVTELEPRSGQTILELGAGTGDTGFQAAALVGDGGSLISTDFSSAMVEVARRRGAQLGLRNVDYRTIDAEHIAREAGSVDGVLCQSGYMLMADPSAALAETRRVLRADGRLALSVWGAPEHNPWGSVAGRFLVEHEHVRPPEPGAPGAFSMASHERTRSLLDAAGFSKVRVAEVAVGFEFGGLDDYERWLMDVGGPLGIAVRALTEEQRSELRAALADAFDPFEAEGGYVVPGVALCAAAS